MTARPEEVEQLAEMFARQLSTLFAGDWILRLVRTKNAERADGTCASHDYCDPNVLMARAFRLTTGRDADLNTEADLELVNAAWTFALGGRP